MPTVALNGLKPAAALDQLLNEGFTKERLARELGFKSPKIAIGKNKCTVEMAGRVERLWNSYMR